MSLPAICCYSKDLTEDISKPTNVYKGMKAYYTLMVCALVGFDTVYNCLNRGYGSFKVELQKV